MRQRLRASTGGVVMVTYNYTGDLQYVTVPQGTFTITAAGAQGGESVRSPRSSGGLGAVTSGDFRFETGTNLIILVGSFGDGRATGGGGGGSFVFIDVDNDNTISANDTLLLAAGGGGGAGEKTNGLGGTSAASGSGDGQGGIQGYDGGGGGGGAGVGGPGLYGGVRNEGDWGRDSVANTGAKGITKGGSGATGGTNGGFGGGGGGGSPFGYVDARGNISGGGGGGGGGYTGGKGGNTPSRGPDGGTPAGFGGTSYIAPEATNTSSSGATNSGDGVVSITCYATGTRISTTRGEIAVEALTVGDLAVTAAGEARAIRWIGHRAYRCQERRDALPVRIAAHAFGKSRPARDLFVSPAHAIAVDVLGDVLIRTPPVKAALGGIARSAEA